MTLIKLEATDGLTHYINPDHIQGITPASNFEGRLISRVLIASNPNDWSFDVDKEPRILAQDICNDTLSVG